MDKLAALLPLKRQTSRQQHTITTYLFECRSHGSQDLVSITEILRLITQFSPSPLEPRPGIQQCSDLFQSKVPSCCFKSYKQNSWSGYLPTFRIYCILSYMNEVSRVPLRVLLCAQGSSILFQRSKRTRAELGRELMVKRYNRASKETNGPLHHKDSCKTVVEQGAHLQSDNNIRSHAKYQEGRSRIPIF